MYEYKQIGSRIRVISHKLIFGAWSTNTWITISQVQMLCTENTVIINKHTECLQKRCLVFIWSPYNFSLSLTYIYSFTSMDTNIVLFSATVSESDKPLDQQYTLYQIMGCGGSYNTVVVTVRPSSPCKWEHIPGGSHKRPWYWNNARDLINICTIWTMLKNWQEIGRYRWLASSW